MIKNFLSKALLSVVMDKSARENLETKKLIKKAAREMSAAGRPPSRNPDETVAAGPSEELPDPLDSLTPEETRQLVMDSLKAAEQELGARPEMTSERQALIQQALSVHKSKVHVLDDISEEQRQKLTFLALQSLKTDPASIIAPGAIAKKKGNK